MCRNAEDAEAKSHPISGASGANNWEFSVIGSAIVVGRGLAARNRHRTRLHELKSKLNVFSSSGKEEETRLRGGEAGSQTVTVDVRK